jgi:flavin-dependent dehydrogenase
MTGERYDAVVLGAGPAGAVAARGIARRGRRVLLLDRATFPRAKVCGCCLNGSALATLAAEGLGDVARLGTPLRAARLSAGGRTAAVGFAGGIAVSREELDFSLIEAATAAGVEFRPGVVGKRVLGGVDTPAGPVAAAVVVVATGLAGDVARGSRLGGGVIAPDASGVRPGEVHMAVGRGGYVGAVRLPDGRLDLAAAFDAGFVKPSGGLGPAADHILREAGSRIRRVTDLSWKGTPALTRTPAAVAGPDWLAVGDAAGYVEPFTGEGMAWAVASGAAAAGLAADWHPGRAAEWGQFFRRRLRPRQRLCRLTAAGLRSPRLVAAAVRVLTVAPRLSAPFTHALNRPLARESA